LGSSNFVNDFCVQFTNARSLKNKLDFVSLERFIAPHDILCFAETWFADDIRDCELFPGHYHAFRGDRIFNGSYCRGGGVLILVPLHFSASLYGCHYCTQAFEAIAVKIVFLNRCFIIVNVYRPPSSFSEKNFSDEFLSYFRRLNLTGKNFLIVGDFNFPYIDWKNERLFKNNKCQNDFLNFCLLNSLAQIVSLPTRAGNILDIALVSDVDFVNHVKIVEPIAGSDHSRVFICLKNVSAKICPKQSYLNFFKADYKTMAKFLVSINWEFNLSFFHSVDDKLQYLNDFLRYLFSLFVPSCVPRTIKVSLPRRLRCSGRQIRRLHSRIKRAGLNLSSCSLYRSLLKSYKNDVLQFFKLLEQRELENTSSKRFWSFIRKKTSGKGSIPTLFDGQNNVVLDSDKAEVFNNYFSTVFSVDNGVLPPMFKSCCNSLDNIVFDVLDVFEVLGKQNLKMSRGPDGIPHIVYRKLSAALALPLFLIFKCSLDSGIVPRAWKEANVIPVFKKGPKSSPANYRPISLTCIACRILEKILSTKIIRFCEENKIFGGNQHGFMRRKSTVTQLLSCLNNWTRSIDNSESVSIAYLDFAKAFDTVSHEKLILVLRNKGINGPLLRWISNFLAGRSQSVLVNSSKSSSKLVSSGVPQGSVLGPLLFVLYISDLPSVVSSSDVFLFADDCKVTFACKRNCSNLSRLQSDLNLISDWARAMQLNLSVDKCQILQINSIIGQPKLSIMGHELPDVDEAKDLGIIFDQKLTFTPHCRMVVKKTANVINFIFRNFKTKETSFLRKMYCTYVLPIIDYGCVIYHPYTVRNIKLIESIQKYFTRRIPEFFHQKFCYLDRLKFLALDTLELRMIKISLCYVYKIMYGYVDLEFAEFFKFSSGAHCTRSNGLKLEIERATKNKRKLFFSHRIVRIWNSLPREAVTSKSVKEFKTCLNKSGVCEVLHQFCVQQF
jgi:hypothetical protein